jgi:hypothetical protein
VPVHRFSGCSTEDCTTYAEATIELDLRVLSWEAPESSDVKQSDYRRPRRQQLMVACDVAMCPPGLGVAVVPDVVPSHLPAADKHCHGPVPRPQRPAAHTATARKVALAPHDETRDQEATPTRIQPMNPRCPSRFRRRGANRHQNGLLKYCRGMPCPMTLTARAPPFLMLLCVGGCPLWSTNLMLPVAFERHHHAVAQADHRQHARANCGQETCT